MTTADAQKNVQGLLDATVKAGLFQNAASVQTMQESIDTLSVSLVQAEHDISILQSQVASLRELAG
jgi:hypothetical protein